MTRKGQGDVASAKPASHRRPRRKRRLLQPSSSLVDDDRHRRRRRDGGSDGPSRSEVPLPYIDLSRPEASTKRRPPLQSVVPHRKFLQGFRSRYRRALRALCTTRNDAPKNEQSLPPVAEDGKTLKQKRSKITTKMSSAKKPKVSQNCSGDEDKDTQVDVPKGPIRHLPRKGVRREDGSDTGGSRTDFIQQTPPPTVLDLLEHETTLCDSPRDRGVVGDSPSSAERLPFGYFECGQQLYRNKLNDLELLKDGFVALHQLVLPQCQSALMTTFDSHATMKASIHLARDVCPDVPKVLLVGHSDFLGMSYCGLCLPPATSVKREWYWMACRPFGRDDQLMHAKILLFRSVEGLRIVVSGNNLTEKQWTEDRDCMWVQDVPASVVAARGNRAIRGGDDEPPMTRLKCFLIDLLKSSAAFYNIDSRMDEELLSFVHSRIERLMGGLDDNAVNSRYVRFVYSFPRTMNRGGWQQLCQAVWELRQLERKKQEALCSSERDDLWYDTDDGDENDAEYGASTMKRINLFAMSGSFGDLKPDFLLQMRMAMSGYRASFKSGSGDGGDANEKKKSELSLERPVHWSAVRNTFCLWPSHETVLSMNPIAVLARCRPMSRKHWETIPDDARKRLFFDAIPNPDGPSLHSSTESQAAAGFGRYLAPNYLGLRLRGGPLSAYHSFAHGKAIFSTTMSNAGKQGKLRGSNVASACNDQPYAAVYVGSHNFSKKAWGIRECRPGNVEFGVLIFTTDVNVATKWRSRLPYDLPDPNTSSPGHYRPGRYWDIFQKVEQTSPHFNFDDGSSVETI